MSGPGLQGAGWASPVEQERDFLGQAQPVEIPGSCGSHTLRGHVEETISVLQYNFLLVEMQHMDADKHSKATKTFTTGQWAE